MDIFQKLFEKFKNLRLRVNIKNIFKEKTHFNLVNLFTIIYTGSYKKKLKKSLHLSMW